MLELSYKLACPDQSLNQAKYILALIAAASGIRLVPKTDNPDILYGNGQSSDTFSIPRQPSETPATWHTNLYENISIQLPRAISGQLIDIQKCQFTFDLIATMGAYLEKELVAYNNSNSKNTEMTTAINPAFDAFIRLFIHALKKCGKIPAGHEAKSLWPDNGSFALGLSHDIDILKRKIPGSLVILAQAIGRGKHLGAINDAWRGLLDSAASQIFGKRNPYCQFEHYLAGGYQSTTFIYSGNRNDSRDPTYDLDSISAELGPYLDKTELALHNGIGDWKKRDRLSADKKAIANRFGIDVKGIRPHYLDCQLPNFWRNLDEFDYSSALGSDSLPGFSGGINIPLFGFTLPEWKTLKVIELPIGLMDCALFTIHDKPSRFKFIDELITSCKANHGLLVIDWHNTSLYENDYPGWLEAYQYLIKKAEQEKAFIGSLGEIGKIWRNHCESVFSS